MRCTEYKNTFGEKVGEIDIKLFCDNIRDGYWFNKYIFPLRKIFQQSKEKYTKAKTKLPCITPSAVLRQSYNKKTKRPCPPKMEDLLEYNRLVIVDFDNLTDYDLVTIPDLIKECKYTYVCFLSPSGRGYKVFVKVGGDRADHKKAFKAVNDFYQKLTGVRPDPSGNNINRLCYVSYDPDCVYNQDAKAFEFQTDLFAVTTPKEKENVQPSSEVESFPSSHSLNSDSLAATFSNLLNKLERDGHSYVEGRKHDYLKWFCIEAFKYGIKEDECTDFFLNNFDAPAKDISSMVEWTYTKYYPHEKGIYKEYNSKKALKKPKEKPTYKAKLFREYTDLVETHTSGFTKEQVELFKEDYWGFVEYLEEGLGIADKKIRDKIVNVFYLEEALKEDFVFRLNLMNGQFEYKAIKSKKYSVLDDACYNSLFKHLMYKKGVYSTPAQIKKSVESEFSPKEHPLRRIFIEWAAKLEDDKTDYINQVASLVKTDAPKGFFNTVFKKWIVGSVANVFVDNFCTNRYCPILVGGQNTGKTKFFKSLWPSEYPEYFYSGEIDLKSKNSDSVLRLVDTFIIVIDEQLAMMENQREWESLKGLITQDRVKKRRVWGKSDTMAPRIANFCGSVNPQEILQDPSGNTRFLTFKVSEHIDLNAFADIDITKFWAQAYYLHKASQKGDFDYLLTPNEWKIMTQYQEKFKKYDVEHQLILDMYEIGNAENYDEFLTTTEIYRAFSEAYPRLNLNPNKIGAALKFLGFSRSRKKRNDGKRAEGWFLKVIKIKEQTSIEELKSA
ncbi:VapE domain-containing protein [Aureispira sp. CCB-E]|uniref:VapE domain-containing protein n=1 Tax=Aureispira sp. CCB-E TaxID=3051121 RepID=UPI0028685848|nr:VapE domain-containing protein [Aureispira sp. CCB-E]WMX17461.1 VapE family protein [Aureispira sp. CCB-E]